MVLSIFDEATMSAIRANLSIFVIGIVAAFMSGLLCIEFLLKYIKKHDFKLFMWYRVLLGIIVIVYTLWK